MTATLGTALLSSAALRIQRYGVPACTAGLVDDTVLAVGSRQNIAVGTLSYVGTVIASGAFGGQSRVHWVAGNGGVGVDGVGVSAWGLTLPARPYHDDGGIMLSAVLADLERDAATVAGVPPLGATLEVADVRLDVAGAWMRPAALGRDLLDALCVAAGLTAGTWWIAPDGSTHLGPRPTSSATLSDLTVDPFDPALLWGMVRTASDNFGALLPGTTLTAPGLPAPLPIASLTVHVGGDDASAEVWGDAGDAEVFGSLVRHVMAPAVDYLGAKPYSVLSAATDGRVTVAAPPGGPFPDAPLLGHAPGIPGASFTMAPGAAVLVVCVGGKPGAPVCVAYPASVLPVDIGINASGTATLGGDAGTGTAIAMATPLLSWLTTSLLPGLALHGITIAAPPSTIGATKAMGV